jgi:hypothetical protein
MVEPSSSEEDSKEDSEEDTKPPLENPEKPKKYHLPFVV